MVGGRRGAAPPRPLRDRRPLARPPPVRRSSAGRRSSSRFGSRVGRRGGAGPGSWVRQQDIQEGEVFVVGLTNGAALGSGVEKLDEAQAQRPWKVGPDTLIGFESAVRSCSCRPRDSTTKRKAEHLESTANVSAVGERDGLSLSPKLEEAEAKGVTDGDLSKLLRGILGDAYRPGTPTTFSAEQVA